MLWPTETSLVPKIPLKKLKYVLSENYLGSGSFSRVHECKHLGSHTHYAAKVILKANSHNKLQLIQNEYRVLQMVSKTGSASDGYHHLVKLHDYFETPQSFYLITDLCTGGDLFDKLVNEGHYTSEADAAPVISSITSGLLFLKLQGVLHRDIKAENIFFKYHNTRPEILIGDFGLSTFEGDKKDDFLNILCGTLSYMAPEILNREPYSYPIDVWAFGVLMYFMFCGYMPFDCETDDETRVAIKTRDFLFTPKENWAHVGGAVRDIISRCFELDPQKRITLEGVDEFFKTHYPDSLTDSDTSISAGNSKSSVHSYELVSEIEDEEREKALASLRETLQSSLSLLSKSKNSIFSLENDLTASMDDNSVRDIHKGAVLKGLASWRFEEKMNGAVCEDPRIVKDFKSAVFSTSRVTSAFNSVNPSRGVSEHHG